MYFRSLQVLRGLAALAVVLYHTHEYLIIIGNNPQTIFHFFDIRFSNGALFFFSLSGFLMAYLIDTGYDRFLLRRFARIFPIYWLAVIVTIVLKVAIFGVVRSPGLIRAMSLLPWGSKHISYPLAVEWTLIYEVFFYLVCATFAIGRMRRWFPAFLILWGTVLVVANQVFGAATPMLPGRREIALSLHNFLFVAGGLSYYVFRRIEHPSRWLQAACAAVALAGFLGAEVLDSMFAKFTLRGSSFSAAILLGAFLDRGRGKPARSSLMEKLGDYSYALYLVHVPVITIVLYVGQERYGLQCNGALGALATGLALLAGWYFGKLDLMVHDAIKRRMISRKPGPSAIPAPMGSKVGASAVAVR